MCRLGRVILGLLVVLGACGYCASQESYFPQKAFGTGQWAQEEADLYSYFLKRLEEPSLFTKAGSKSTEAYRFLWLRTFHNPIAVRLEIHADGTGVLTTKTGDGHSGFPNTVKKLSQATSRTLSREEVETFRNKVRTEGFWNLKSRDPGGPTGTDCDGWILEGAANGKYHVVSRTIPNALPKGTMAVESLGLMLAIGLGRLEIPTEER